MTSIAREHSDLKGQLISGEICSQLSGEITFMSKCSCLFASHGNGSGRRRSSNGLVEIDGSEAAV